MTRNKPLVSVIITTKNEEKCIKRCLIGIKCQTYRRLEIIVVDNFSVDKTCPISKNFTPYVYKHGPERSSQRNFGAQKANGSYILFLDADMKIKPTVIEECVRLITQNSEMKAVIIPERTVGRGFWARCRQLERDLYLEKQLIEAARFFNKTTFLDLGGYDEHLIAGEDWDLTLRIKRSGAKIARIKSFALHYEDQLSLITHLQKKYYYATQIRYYAQKHPAEFKKQSSIFTRLPILLRGWKRLIRDPLHTSGLFILKSTEYALYLYVKICHKP